MRRVAVLIAAAAICAAAQVRTVTLREAVDLAAKQNPDVALAGLDERKAGQAVRVARDPFVPKVPAGSGLAYSSGIPLSIAGATPSIVQAQASQFILNRQQTYLVAQARENERGAAISTAARREQAALRAAQAYLDAERARRMEETAARQVARLERLLEIVRLRVAEGRELPIEEKKAALNLARARQRWQSVESERRYAEDSLGVLLGLDPAHPVRVAMEDRPAPRLPEDEDAAAGLAIDNSRETRQIESALAAKGFEIRAQQAARLPRVDLVAGYALLGRFNNYEDFFRKFQRHNGQIGVSFQIPLLAGPAIGAQRFQAESDAARLRLELRSARDRITVEARRLYQQVRQAESAREIARLELEVARDQVSVLLAQMDEGRASLRQVEEARLAEDDKWLALLDGDYNVELARLNLLHHTGQLLAALR
jgi:outer membrane protein TolC